MSNTPRKVNFFKENGIKIVKVEAGCRHSLFLDSKAKVYGCGFSKGKNKNTERIYYPQLFEDLSELGILDVFAGDGINVAIDKHGTPFKWEGASGEIHGIKDLGGRYISQAIVGNKNIVIVT